MMAQSFILKNLSLPFRMCQPSELEKPDIIATSCSSSTRSTTTEAVVVVDDDAVVVSPASHASSRQQRKRRHKQVTFSTVHIREYPITLAPGGVRQRGPAIELDGWDCYRDRPVVRVDDDVDGDDDDTGKKSAQHLFQPLPLRMMRLQRLQYTRHEILQACTLPEQQQQQQSTTEELFSPIAWMIQQEIKALRRTARLQRALHRLQHHEEYYTAAGGGMVQKNSSKKQSSSSALQEEARQRLLLQDDGELHRRLYAWPGGRSRRRSRTQQK